MALSFKDIEEERVSYFGSIYKAKRRATIAEVLTVSNFFPNFVNPDDRLDSIMLPTISQGSWP